jgi:hypothetical protein
MRPLGDGEYTDDDAYETETYVETIKNVLNEGFSAPKSDLDMLTGNDPDP